MKERLEGLAQALKNPAWLCFAWLGMAAGIALIETPARFSAPAAGREAAIDIGRVVFGALNKAELVALILLLIIVRVSGRARAYWAPCGALIVILIAQSAWLLPELADRAQQIVGGAEPAPSSVHAIYTGLELLKYLVLLFIGFRSLWPSSSSR